MREEIEGLHKEIARIEKQHEKQWSRYRISVEAAYSRWFKSIQDSDLMLQTQKEHPMLQWGQPNRDSAKRGYYLSPKGYPGGRRGHMADTLYFATRADYQNRNWYRYFRECKEEGLLKGTNYADDEFDEPSPFMVSFLEPNTEHIERWQFGNEERRKKIIDVLEKKHAGNS